eukprot:GFUD01112592.1.p1 GENE.GFUD01112592.1~~GFUD01112592.1.p1  ORF type:complete len:139 (+),score=49.49 GFUD01112592.1:42-419(+)
MAEDIPYYKDYVNNAIRGGIVSGCFLSIFIVIGIVNKFKWKGDKDEESVHEYEVSGRKEIIEHNDVIKVAESCQEFDANSQIDLANDCKVSEEDESEKSSSTKADDDSSRDLTGCENAALELEEK